MKSTLKEFIKKHVKSLVTLSLVSLSPAMADPILVSTFTAGNGTTQFINPYGIAIDAQNSNDPTQQQIFVSDLNTNKVIQFNGLGQNPTNFM